jgi:hypothetical protein
MKKAELNFRHYIEPRMKGLWLMTWHEDREISPGVPDLHYGFRPDDLGEYQIGWLELKATDENICKSNRISVEASQHQYYRRWLPLMKIHFLIRVKTRCYLIPGKWHEQIPKIDNENVLCSMDCIWFDQKDIAAVLPDALKDITRI